MPWSTSVSVLGWRSGVGAWVYLLIRVIKVRYICEGMMYILVIMCAAPPILVGAGSMAVLLG